MIWFCAKKSDLNSYHALHSPTISQQHLPCFCLIVMPIAISGVLALATPEPESFYDLKMPTSFVSFRSWFKCHLFKEDMSNPCQFANRHSFSYYLLYFAFNIIDYSIYFQSIYYLFLPVSHQNLRFMKAGDLSVLLIDISPTSSVTFNI